MKSWAEDLLAAVMLMMDSVHLLSSRWWREDHIPQRPPPKDDLIYLNVTPSYYCRCLAWCNRRATTGALVLINTWKGTSTPGPRVDVSRLKKSPLRGGGSQLNLLRENRRCEERSEIVIHASIHCSDIITCSRWSIHPRCACSPSTLWIGTKGPEFFN